MNLGDFRVHIPKIEPPKVNLKTAAISATQIKEMKDEEIKAVLTGEKDMGGMLPLSLQQALSNELLTRQIKEAGKPHWSTPYNFWIGLVAMVAASTAAYFTILPRSSQSSTVVLSSPVSKQSVQSVASSSRKQLIHTQSRFQRHEKRSLSYFYILFVNRVVQCISIPEAERKGITNGSTCLRFAPQVCLTTFKTRGGGVLCENCWNRWLAVVENGLN